MNEGGDVNREVVKMPETSTGASKGWLRGKSAKYLNISVAAVAGAIAGITLTGSAFYTSLFSIGAAGAAWLDSKGRHQN